MRGMPYLVRIQTGLRKPKATRLGVDLAGQVEAVGKNVMQFQPGDEVFGTCRGAFAEHGCASERALVLKPANGDVRAGGGRARGGNQLPTGLRDKGQIKRGQKVLINGAAGEKELAIKNYEKSLQLNPKSQSGIDALKKLKAQ
jgi:NADPH:quinone reductase-like Zn-dependent oxidoreductase